MPGSSIKPGQSIGDIRDFFGNHSAKPTASGSLKISKSADPIEISDDESTTFKKPKKPNNSAMRIVTDSDEEVLVKKVKPQQSTNNKNVQSSKPTTAGSKEATKPGVKRKSNVLMISSDEEEEEVAPPRKKTAISTSASHKPKAAAKMPSKPTKKPSALRISDDDDVEEKPRPKKSVAKPTSPQNHAEEAPAPKPKVNFAAIAARRAAGPIAPGSKQIPIGQPNCLSGLTFVFTGELQSLSREEASDLAKRYGGRVTGGPSSKTSYVVLGSDAGPAKLKLIEKHGLKTLNEDQFLELIATSEGVLDEKTKQKLQKEEEKIKQDAQEMETRERKESKAAKKQERAIDPSTQLWTSKYAPRTLKDICGNKGAVEKIQLWLHDWPESVRVGFKHGGKNAINQYRALLVYGSPGIGKTTSAHLCAELEGYTPIELNASDARNKKLIENAANVNNTSLDGWMAGGEATNAAGIKITDKTVLIMDEVDGMSAGDRGGVGALNALIKKTKIPIICIANDVQSQKLKPLMATTAKIHFTKPTAAVIKSRLLSICYKEKLNIPANVLEQLIAGAQSDIRQVLNMLSTWKLSKGSMDFDEGQELAKSNEKYAILTPFACTNKVLGPYLFSRTSRETLGEKMEYYFHEPSLMPLFIQENYMKMNPARANNLMGPDQEMKVLELMEKASGSVSDGDMVDSMLRGSEQHWSLMPLHACMSLVRPASFMYGQTASGNAYKDGASFPQWLGQNSKQQKLARALGDIQAKMRMKVSGDKSEIRRQYIPALFPHIIQPLLDKDKPKDDVITDVIETMDEYYLSKDDWDVLVELGVGPRQDAAILKAIPAAIKASFTRKYNTGEHPIAFHKGTDLGIAPRRLAARDMPDVEEAFDLDDDVMDEEEAQPRAKASNKAVDDKLIKERKPKGGTKQ